MYISVRCVLLSCVWYCHEYITLIYFTLRVVSITVTLFAAVFHVGITSFRHLVINCSDVSRCIFDVGLSCLRHIVINRGDLNTRDFHVGVSCLRHLVINTGDVISVFHVGLSCFRHLVINRHQPPQNKQF